jgi:dienelactone hydrolase
MSPRAALALALLLASPAGGAAAQDGMPKPTVKEVTLETSDGLKLPADLYEPGGGGDGKPAVLAFHAAASDRSSWKAVGTLLSEHGVSLLAPDLRGHGAARGQKAEAEWPAADDPALWKSMALDAEAGVKYLRGTLMADAKNLGVLGAGAGAGLALLTAEKEPKVRAFFGVAPAPAACGQAGLAAAVRWNGRPAGFVVGKADEKGESAALAKELSKQPRTDVLVIPMEKKTPPAELLGHDLACRDAAQFFVGWLTRPVFTGKREEGVSRSGGKGVIFGGGSSFGIGNCAGSLRFDGYFAPGKISSVVVLADPDRTSKKLTTASRRITVSPVAAKEQTLSVAIETWTGTAWKKEKPFNVLDCGTFVVDGKTTFYEVWLPPWVLGVAPFSEIAYLSGAVVDGELKWPGDVDISGMGRLRRSSHNANDPSSWNWQELR